MKEDWIEYKLGDIHTIVYGKGLPTKKLINDGYPVFGANGIIGNYSEYKYEEKQVLISCRGAASGTINISPSKCFITNNSLVVETDSIPQIGKYFLYYMLQGANRTKIITGSAQPQVTINNANTLRLNLAPLPIQRAIVTKIESLFSDLDNGITDLKKAQEQLKLYRQAVLKKAFEGELTKEWREKQTNLPTAVELLEQIKEERQKHYEQQLEDWKKAVKAWEVIGKEGKKPIKPRKTIDLDELQDILYTIPNKWKWYKLGNVASKISDGPFGSNLKTSDYVESGIQVVRLENIGNLVFKDSKKTFVTKEKYESVKKHSVYPKDLVFSSFISENVSVVSIPEHIKIAVNKADCFCIRFNHLVIFKYFEYFLSSRKTYNQIVTKAHGATRPRINTTQLKEVLVPICSRQEQHQIVQEIESRLSICDKVGQSIHDSIERTQALRQSILRKAFEGKLLSPFEVAKCKQEKDYKPARELIKKINADKS